MKKIGIVTLGNSLNYGGVLQATALSTFLKSEGARPIMVTVQKMPHPWNSILEYVSIRIRLYGCRGFYTKLRILGGCGKVFLSNRHFIAKYKKIKKFREFISDNMETTRYYKTCTDIKMANLDFDSYIVGSDQVWNADFNFGELDDRFFLKFVPEGRKKYAYAASVGGNKTTSYIKKIIENTKDFERVTVREETLEKQIKYLQGQADTMVDPTFLLGRREWEKLEAKPNFDLPSKYILTYFLESSSRNNKLINELAQKTGYSVLDIGDEYGFSTYKRVVLNSIGPSEFLYLCHHAEYVITNSFHMTVFSILYNRHFIVIPRDGQQTRVKDLLGKLHLEKHIVTETDSCKCIFDSYEIYPDLIRYQIEQSMDFLRKIVYE